MFKVTLLADSVYKISYVSKSK